MSKKSDLFILNTFFPFGRKEVPNFDQKWKKIEIQTFFSQFHTKKPLKVSLPYFFVLSSLHVFQIFLFPSENVVIPSCLLQYVNLLIMIVCTVKSNLVMTNSTGLQKYIRYSRESIITMNISNVNLFFRTKN